MTKIFKQIEETIKSEKLVKIVCDKCNKEIKNKEDYYRVCLTEKNYSEYDYTYLDICNKLECIDSVFKQFINNIGDKYFDPDEIEISKETVNIKDYE